MKGTAQEYSAILEGIDWHKDQIELLNNHSATIIIDKGQISIDSRITIVIIRFTSVAEYLKEGYSDSFSLYLIAA